MRVVYGSEYYWPGSWTDFINTRRPIDAIIYRAQLLRLDKAAYMHYLDYLNMHLLLSRGELLDV